MKGAGTMSYLFWKLFTYVSRAILSLRYRIEIKGLERLSEKELKQPGGTLFLPNHPALMDPLFIFLILWPRFRMRPIVIEYIYRMPILRPFMKLIRALSIPCFDTSVNQLKIKKAQASFREIAEGLKKGDNFILYPSGRLKNTGKEILGGSSGAHSLVQECPQANIVLIRTTGLWGSSFSRALIGRSPDLMQTLWHGLKVIVKNGIFFAPRRKVTIEIEPNPADFPRSQISRVEFNRYLEKWYNRYPHEQGNPREEEPITLISYSFWRNEVPKVFEPKKKREGALEAAISAETKDKIYGEIRRILENADLEITPDLNLAMDLGMDSLNIADMVTFLAQNWDIGELHPEELDTVQSVLELAEGARTASPTSIHQVQNKVRWPEQAGRPEPLAPQGETIPEAFLRCCDRMGSYTACADDVVGVMSYKKMKRAALVLAQAFSAFPETHVAVLLPASVGSFIVILALQLAGKTPVMLNWTLGSRYLEEMMKIAGAKRVISSWRFMERLSHVEFGSLVDQMCLIEDLRQTLTLKQKLKGAFLSLLSCDAILRSLSLKKKIQGDSQAVILYTSGTESMPKGVPLSHGNILSNQRAVTECVPLSHPDILYGILPPFHSFGFTVTGLFPLLIGVRVAFYPDPTDSFALAEGVERWGATLFCSAPSFLKGLFYAAKKEQLKSVRLFVTGAEKAPQELYDRVKNLSTGALLVEGYGLTECSPVLTFTRPNLPPKGVGQPLPGVELCTIHLETQELLAKGKEGEVCAIGPNVFKGYVGTNRSPFIELNGRQWYRTGDIGYLDADNHLILSGRLKRFTKIGGEMISLAAIEEALSSALVKQGKIHVDVPSLAVCADERVPGKPQLILFTTFAFDKETANEMLRELGFSRLIKISAVKTIEEIPLMAIGKTHYPRLQSLIT